jgi:hypothetical protein
LLGGDGATLDAHLFRARAPPPRRPLSKTPLPATHPHAAADGRGGAANRATHTTRGTTHVRLHSTPPPPPPPSPMLSKPQPPTTSPPHTPHHTHGDPLSTAHAHYLRLSTPSPSFSPPPHPTRPSTRPPFSPTQLEPRPRDNHASIARRALPPLLPTPHHPSFSSSSSSRFLLRAFPRPPPPPPPESNARSRSGPEHRVMCRPCASCAKAAHCPHVFGPSEEAGTTAERGWGFRG